MSDFPFSATINRVSYNLTITPYIPTHVLVLYAKLQVSNIMSSIFLLYSEVIMLKWSLILFTYVFWNWHSCLHHRQWIHVCWKLSRFRFSSKIYKNINNEVSIYFVPLSGKQSLQKNLHPPPPAMLATFITS